MNLKFDQQGNICLWFPRKSHFLFKVTDDMNDDINKQYVQVTLNLVYILDTTFNLFVFADSYGWSTTIDGS